MKMGKIARQKTAARLCRYCGRDMVSVRHRITTAVIGDVTGLPPGDRPDLLTVTMLKVRDQERPLPLMLMELDPGEFIDLKFLVFRGMGIIKCPLLEWDVSADKI